MIFEYGMIYKHEKCLDACVLVIHKQYQDEKRVKVRVIFCDEQGRAYSNPTTIEIQVKDIQKWKLVR